MSRLLGLLLVAVTALLGLDAHAAGTTVQPPGFEAAPEIDLSAVTGAASQRKEGPDGKPHQVHARLLTDKSAAVPGGTIRVGLHLEQDENWHTYWRSPGAVGQPTDITWSLPQGSENSDYAYPAPAFFELSGIISYGYEDEVLFYTDVTLPQDISGTITLGADATWLVCEVQCIPGDAQLSLELPVADTAEATPWAPLFDHYAKTHPLSPLSVKSFAVETVLSQSAVRPNDEFKVAMLFTPTGAELSPQADHGPFPFYIPIATPGWMAMSEPVMETLPDGKVKIVMEGYALEADPLPEDEAFGGLFQVKVGDEWVRTEISARIPFQAEGSDVTANEHPLFGDASGLTVAATPATGGTADGSGAPPVGEEKSLLAMLGLAFLGGMLLNVMPCVLPVITLKLYGLVEQVGITNLERQKAGAAYTAGIVGSFLILATVVVLLRGTFDLSVGWGFQFQYPGYVIALGTIVFAFGLSLFGVFEIPAFGENAMSEASDKEGAMGYLLSGAFATLLATPCSAPFLGTGMGFAFSLPSWGILLFFAVAGFGLAFPFLLIAFVPALYRFLPQPGAWMETFKQFLGFTLMATTVWLVDVVASQTGRAGGTGFLIFLMFVGLAAWFFGRFGGLSASRRNQAVSLVVAVLISAVAGWKFLVTEVQAADSCAPTELAEDLDFSEEIPWQPFNESTVAASAGQAAFIDFTADWCLTCKVNEKNILETETIRSAMAEMDIVPLKADWTTRDENITEWLQRYGKAGVPFYLVLPADRSQPAIPLPEVITKDIVLDGLAQAVE